MLVALLFVFAEAALILASPGKTSLQEVSEALTCQCGCGLTVANCNHPQCEFSVPVRKQIAGLIAQGEGKVQIIGFFRARYGEKILSAPTTEGFNLLAWIMPFAAVLAGCFIIVSAVSRWHGGGKPEPEPPEPNPPPYDSELRKRLESDLREHP